LWYHKGDACWYIADSFSLWVERLAHSENKSGHEKSSLYFYKLQTFFYIRCDFFA